MDETQAVMRALCTEHTAAPWHYVLLLTGDRPRAEEVVRETLLRASRHLEIARDSEGSARAWLLTTARAIIIAERDAT